MLTNDSQAIGAVLRGDRDQYSVLVDKYKKMVYAIAWSHLGDSELSEDVAQETFIKAYSYLGTLRDPEAFPGWLSRIARNVCGTFHRRAKRERAFTQRLGVLESAEPVSQEDDREGLDEQLWKAFADLSIMHREALTLFHVEGKSSREAAAALGITESALRTRLHRARIALREHLERRLEDTLGTLQPSKDFTRSVFALLPLAPKGAAGAGGAFALIGKLAACVSFTFWIVAAQIAWTSGLAMWISKKAMDDIHDTPENQFRKVLIRRQAVTFAIVLAAITVISFVVSGTLLTYAWSPQAYIRVIALCFTPFMLQPLLFLRVNSSPYSWGRLIIAYVNVAMFYAVGFVHAPYMIAFPLTQLISILTVAVTKEGAPRRVDRNLFLRAATGGLRDSADEAGPPPIALTRTQLLAFMRFLGEQWLVADYAIRRGTLFLFLPCVSGWELFKHGSYVAIEPDGRCTARVNPRDLKSIRAVAPACPDEQHLQAAVCGALRYALDCFLKGDLAEAHSAVTAQSDEAVFEQSLENSKAYKAHRLMIIVGIVAAVLMGICFYMRSLTP